MPRCSQRGLEPGRKPRFARTATRMILAVEMGEHDFMGEERRPFKGGGAVGITAADQLVLAVGLANQFGVAKLADDLAAVALWEDVFQFHTRPRYPRGVDNGCGAVHGGRWVRWVPGR